jgi:hypothetical protein
MPLGARGNALYMNAASTLAESLLGPKLSTVARPFAEGSDIGSMSFRIQ